MGNEEKGKKQQSIRKTILKTVLILLGTSLVLLGVISVALNYYSTVDSLEQTMQEAAVLAADSVSNELETYRTIVIELGCAARLSSSDVSDDAKDELIQQKVKSYGLVRGKMIRADGIALDGTDYSDRDYFRKSMNGETCITEPIKAKTDGKMSVIISAPIWEGGVPNTTVVGVVFVLPEGTFLNDIVSGIQVSGNGSAYMLDAQGNTIAHRDTALVEALSNTGKDAETDSSLKALAALEKQMTNGEAGFGNYTYGGVNKFLAFAPVEGTDGWSIALNAPISDFMSSTYLGIALTLFLVAISITVAGILVARLASRIGNPIYECAQRLTKLAQGDLASPVPVIKSRDETKTLADATGEIVGGMNTMIGDVKYLLGSMSEGNFDIRTKAEQSYVGDFSGILLAIGGINTRLSDTLLQIQTAADQVNVGSGQMAEGAQSLAEGATDQAAAVEELLATVEDVTNTTKEGTQNAIHTSEEAKKIGSRTRANTEKISEVTAAMERITNASLQIESIIKSIEDIATQTNLLSLNASIEAARAGEAGKGFAVVATEIGHLAGQSAQAADETRKLIATALEEVKNGNGIVEQTAGAMDEVIGDIEKVVDAIGAVAENSENQLTAIEQINQGIEQISGVIQSNSATAEESSATSEELSAQAAGLNELISVFHLKQ